MRRLHKYLLLTVLLATSMMAAGQYSIDKVCSGAIRHYRIDGEPNSTFTWKLTDTGGVQTVLPSTADTVEINWSVVPGMYYLSCVQHSDSLCDAIIEIGYIEVFSQPTAYAGNDSTLCGASTIILAQATASNYSSVTWSSSGDGSFNDIHILNPIYTPGVNDLNTEVELTLSASGLGNGNSCQSAVSSLNLTFGNLSIISALATDATCGLDNGTITVVASTGSATVLQYSIDGGLTWSVNNVFTNLAAGSYNIKVKDDNCEVAYPNNPVVINTIGGPQIISVTATDATCGLDNGTITVVASTGSATGMQYSIDGGATWSVNNVFTNLAAGSYIIKVKDDNCEVIYPGNPVILNTSSAPVITSVMSVNANCGKDNGMISIHTQGGDSLMFSINNGGNWSYDSVFASLPAGEYIIRVKNEFCTTDFTNNPVMIFAVPLPEITSVVSTNPSCHGGSNGSAFVSVSGGSAPYSFEWSDPLLQTQSTAANLSAGFYQVIVTDASGCHDTASVILTEPDSLLLVTADVIHNQCFGDHEGSIQVTVSGGQGPYLYSWNLGGTGSSITALGAGQYMLTVTDSRGCILDTTLLVNQPEQLFASVSITSPILVMGGSATIEISAIGGTAPYSGTGTYYVNAGTYNFQVTDASGCIATTSIIVPDAGKVLTADTSACLGNHMEIPLIVYNFREIVLFHLNLKYNPLIMEFAGFRSVVPEITTGLIIQPNPDEGRLIADWNQSTPVTLPDSAQLLQLVFKAINPGLSKIGLYDTVSSQNRFVNDHNQLINVQYKQGMAKVIQPAMVEIIGANEVSLGEPLELMVMAWTGNPAAYDWTGPGNIHTDKYNLKIDPFLEQNEGFYTVKVLDHNGCISGDTTFINAGIRQIGRIIVPNAFTPNGDGLNDDFLVYTNLDVKFQFRMLVFNKWGQQLFESNDIMKGWDGTFKGEECQPDLYTWIIYFTVPASIEMEQKSPLKGVVMLVK